MPIFYPATYARSERNTAEYIFSLSPFSSTSPLREYGFAFARITVRIVAVAEGIKRSLREEYSHRREREYSLIACFSITSFFFTLPPFPPFRSRVFYSGDERSNAQQCRRINFAAGSRLIAAGKSPRRDSALIKATK